MKKTPKKPEGFESHLGTFGPQLYDSWCGEPVAWGFKIVSQMGEEKFEQLKKVATLDCCYPTWFVITDTLTRKDAIKKYGAVTNEEFGPRRGWKSVTFGKTTFISKCVKG